MKKTIIALLLIIPLIANAQVNPIDAEMRAKELGNSIKLNLFALGMPNSAGGRDVRVTVTNLLDKSIKYIYFNIAFQNAVGDPAPDDITGDTLKTFQIIGPINKGKKKRAFFSCAIYNYNAVSAFMRYMLVEYMDGTKLEVYKNEFDYIYKRPKRGWVFTL